MFNIKSWIPRIKRGTTRKVLLILFCYGCFISFAFANNPVDVLESIAHNMITGLKANQATLKSKPQIVYNLAHKYVVPYADLTEMSKRVLPPTVWQQASEKQRQQFQQEFTTTIIRTYASALTSYQDQQIRFYPVRGQIKNNVEVAGEITGNNSDPIHVTYRMVQNGNEWRLYDMSVEGVSMLESFRSQFANILAQGNMAQLLGRMTAHNKRARG